MKKNVTADRFLFVRFRHSMSCHLSAILLLPVHHQVHPLSRSFYIAYYENDNELEQEFLRFIRGKGQETVEKQYVAVGKASTFVSLRPKGTIMVDGSTSIAPLMEVIAEEYMQQNPEAEIVIEESDSSKGIDSVIKRTQKLQCHREN